MPGFTYPSAVPSILIGGVLFTDLANLKQLVATSGGSATTDKSTFRLPGASSGYVVPANKTFRVMAARTRLYATATSGAPIATILYGDADVGNAGNTAFTTPIYRGGAAALSQTGNQSQIQAPGGALTEECFLFDIPTGKYPSVQFANTSSAAYATLYGYEI